MHIVLCGQSGYEWWMNRASVSCNPGPRVSGRRNAAAGPFCTINGISSFDDTDHRVLHSASPTTRAVSLLEGYSFLSQPYHCLVSSESDARRDSRIKMHYCGSALGKGSFVRVADGLVVASPEISFIQYARTLSVIDAARRGSELCGVFSYNAAIEHGLQRVDAITSGARIASVAQRDSCIRGSMSARRIAPHLLNGAASPPEVELALRLSLPRRYGGFGFKKPELNYVVSLNDKASRIAGRDYLVADVCWPDERIVLEYDSNSVHLDAAQLSRDATKRDAYGIMGYESIIVTATRMKSAPAMEELAERVRKVAGWRKPQYVKEGYEAMRREFACSWVRSLKG